MKRFIVTFMGCIFFAISLHAEEQQIGQLLRSKDWRERDNAVHMILRDFEKHQNNDVLKQEVLEALSKVNEKLRSQENGRIFQGEGPGETYLDLLSLVIKLDIPNSTEVLLDSADSGNAVEDAIVKRLMNEGEDEFKTLDSIKQKIASSDIYYKRIRSGHFRIIQKYLKKNPAMSKQKRAIVKDIVLNGMLLSDLFAKKYAIRCSQYFRDDNQIIEELKKISTTDNNTQLKDGVKIFPLREEAFKVLEEIETDPAPDTTTPLPESTVEPQIQSEQQAISGPKPSEPAPDLKKTGVLALIVVAVICGVGYMMYRLKSQRK